MAGNKVVDLIPEINKITDEGIRQKVINIWEEVVAAGGWEHPRQIPFNTAIGASPSLIDHTRSVTHAALSFADGYEQIFGKSVDRDLLVAGAILHDVCKAIEFKPDAERPTKSEIGVKLPHGFFGGFLALKAGLPLDYIHLILTHTPTVKMLPDRLEGIILQYADLMDADCHFFVAGLPTIMSKSK